MFQQDLERGEDGVVFKNHKDYLGKILGKFYSVINFK